MSKSTRVPKKEGKVKKGTGKTISSKRTESAKSMKTEAKQKTPVKKVKTKKPAKRTAKSKEQLKRMKKEGPRKRTTSVDNEHILKELETEIQSDDQQVCLGAIERLSKLKDPRATDILIQGLGDSRQMIRIHSAAQLGERKDPKATDALINSLGDESVFVRQTVARALESIGGAKAKRAVAKSEKEGFLLDELPEGRRLAE